MDPFHFKLDEKNHAHGFKTELDIKPFFFKFSVQPRFLPGFGGFNRTGLAPGSWLNRSNRPVRSGFLNSDHAP